MSFKDPGFLGRGWAFPPSFDPHTGAAVLVTAAEDINQSLRILFETRPGERVMQPEFGCRIHDYLFDPMNNATMRGIEAAIARAILFYEPRIQTHDVRAQIKSTQAQIDAGSGQLDIAVLYTITQTNTRHNAVFPFYITQGTLITDKPVEVLE